VECVTHILEAKHLKRYRGGGPIGSALHEAAYHSHPKIVELLLKRGFSANKKAGIYHSPLQAAAAGCHPYAGEDLSVRVIEILVTSRAD